MADQPQYELYLCTKNNNQFIPISKKFTINIPFLENSVYGGNINLSDIKNTGGGVTIDELFNNLNVDEIEKRKDPPFNCEVNETIDMLNPYKKQNANDYNIETKFMMEEIENVLKQK